jgi:hypothetical protein
MMVFWTVLWLKRIYLLCVIRVINNCHFLAIFEVLKALLIKIWFFWDMTPCILVYTFQRFSEVCWIRLQDGV